MSSTCCAELRRLVRQAVDQVGMELPGGQHARAVGGDPQQVGDARLVDGEERVEHRRDEDARRGRAAPSAARSPRDPARAASTTPVVSSTSPIALRSAPRLPIAWPNCCASSPSMFWLARSPRVAAIWCRSTSGSEKCWNSATMSANASWKASTSGLLDSMKRRCMPSSSACVISWATMSCDRQVKTVSGAAPAPSAPTAAGK